MRRLLTAVLLLGGCAAPDPSVPTAMNLSPCRFAGLDRPARCTTLEVPEVRERPGGRSISLRVVVIPARQAGPDDPVVLIAGGPGQGAVQTYLPMLPAFDALGRDRDVVLVDQRGTGQSAPLACPEPDTDVLEQLSLDVDVERLAQCRENLTAEPDAYGTPEAVADLEAVRRALGYPALNLIGGSYGTRVALAYMRTHPETTRSVVLDGAVPPDMRLPLSFAADAQAALDQLVADCLAQPACARTFPELRTDIEAVLAAAEARPTVQIEHPRSGAPMELQLDPEMVGAAIRAMLYVPDLSALLPLSIRQAKAGDWEPLLAQVLVVAEGTSRSMFEGMYLSVVCSEDVPFIDDAAIEQQTEGTFMGDAMVKSLRQSCQHWPVPPVDRSFLEPVASDVPVLLLSGRMDPATPARLAEQVAQTLTRARHLVIPAAGHGTLATPCMDEVLHEFIETADPAAVDEGCVVAVPPPSFFVDLAGPPVEQDEPS